MSCCGRVGCWLRGYLPGAVALADEIRSLVGALALPDATRSLFHETYNSRHVCQYRGYNVSRASKSSLQSQISHQTNPSDLNTLCGRCEGIEYWPSGSAVSLCSAKVRGYLSPPLTIPLRSPSCACGYQTLFPRPTQPPNNPFGRPVSMSVLRTPSPL